MISPSRLKAKRMVYSIPRRASSFGGGVQHARNAAYISRIESKDFSCAASSVSLALLSAPASGVLGESSSSVETMFSRRSWPIGGRNCGNHGPKSKTLQNDESGSLLGSPGETGVCLTLGTVYGVDGLKTGGGGGAGGGGGTNCFTSACVSAPPMGAIKVVTKNVATAQRPNLANGICCVGAPILLSQSPHMSLIEINLRPVRFVVTFSRVRAWYDGVLKCAITASTTLNRGLRKLGTS